MAQNRHHLDFPDSEVLPRADSEITLWSRDTEGSCGGANKVHNCWGPALGPARGAASLSPAQVPSWGARRRYKGPRSCPLGRAVPGGQRGRILGAAAFRVAGEIIAPEFKVGFFHISLQDGRMQPSRVWGTRNRLQILERGPQLGCGLPAGSWAAGRGWEAGCPRPGRRLRRGRSGLSSHLVPVPISAPREARPGPAPRTCRAPIASRRPATKAAPVQLQPGPRPAPWPPAREDPAPAPAPPARSPPPRALTAGPTARAQGTPRARARLSLRHPGRLSGPERAAPREGARGHVVGEGGSGAS